MKKFVAIVLALALSLCCVSALAAEKLTVIATPSPHAEILELIKEDLAALGYDLDVLVVTDYVTENPAVAGGDVQANFFQHIPYLADYNATASDSEKLVGVIPTHFEPMGIYSKSISDLKELKDGAKVAVPNDATNEARALLLLQQEGLITLKDGVGVTATVNDIVSNPKNLTFNELEAANVPNVVDDVDIAIINGNYAIAAGFKVNTDALAVESADSEAAKTYANLLVVKDGNQDSDKIKALAEALNSDEVRDYINNTYEGAVVPVF